MTDRGDRGARRLKAAWNRLADRVRARMEHVPPNGTAPVAPASGGTNAPMVDRLTARCATLECDLWDAEARADQAGARVRELETAARAVVEAEAALLRTPTLGQVDTSEAAIEALARLLGVELPD
jgi:hypothetical protein